VLEDLVFLETTLLRGSFFRIPLGQQVVQAVSVLGLFSTSSVFGWATAATSTGVGHRHFCVHVNRNRYPVATSSRSA